MKYNEGKKTSREETRKVIHDIRKIVHADCDAFYASIEQRDHPAYRGKPVIVGGDPEKRGVVSTASYEARAYGVHSAQSAKTARRLCPHAIFLRPRFEIYQAVSREILSIYREYTSRLEPLSLDEAYLDVTSNHKDMTSATLLARELKQRVREQTGLTISVGVSYCKSLAKIASDAHKPDGLTVITPQQAEHFLAALPVSTFLGVGKVTAAKLEAHGLSTGADVRQWTQDQLYGLLGKQGIHLYHLVRGEDDRPVEPERKRKSVGKESTLGADIGDREAMLGILEQLAAQVEQRLKEGGIAGKTITLKITFADFEHITRAITLTRPIQDAQAMRPWLRSLLSCLDGNTKLVRLLGVTVSTLGDVDTVAQSFLSQQLSLWEEGNAGAPLASR